MTEPSTIDAAAKERVVAALRAHVADEGAALDRSAHEEESAAVVDRDQVLDEGDRALADEAALMTASTERSEARQQDAQAHLASLDFSPTDVVRDGALIGFDGDRYVVGVVTDAFECDGVTYEGISSDSPVHAALLGLHAGDAFTVGGREHRLELVA